jgi:hypothetical protein
MSKRGRNLGGGRPTPSVRDLRQHLPSDNTVDRHAFSLPYAHPSRTSRLSTVSTAHPLQRETSGLTLSSRRTDQAAGAYIYWGFKALDSTEMNTFVENQAGGHYQFLTICGLMLRSVLSPGRVFSLLSRSAPADALGPYVPHSLSRCLVWLLWPLACSTVSLVCSLPTSCVRPSLLFRSGPFLPSLPSSVSSKAEANSPSTLSLIRLSSLPSASEDLPPRRPSHRGHYQLDLLAHHPHRPSSHASSGQQGDEQLGPDRAYPLLHSSQVSLVSTLCSASFKKGRKTAVDSRFAHLSMDLARTSYVCLLSGCSEVTIC